MVKARKQLQQDLQTQDAPLTGAPSQLTRPPVYLLIQKIMGVFLLQPALDWLSYLFNDQGWSIFPLTLVRGLLLVYLVWLGCQTSSRATQLLLAAGGLLGGFWLLHYGLGWLSGVTAWRLDAVNYAKMVQLPLSALVFIEVMRSASTLEQEALVLSQTQPEVSREAVEASPQTIRQQAPRATEQIAHFMGLLMTLNFVVILLADAVAALTHTGRLTYLELERGFLGWYFNANAQSILMAALYPVALVSLGRLQALPQTYQPAHFLGRLLVTFARYRHSLFVGVALLGGIRLFFFGTRVTFYGLLGGLVAAAVIIGFARGKQGLWRAGFLMILLGVTLLGRQQAPMVQLRQADQVIAQQELTDFAKKNQLTDLIEQPSQTYTAKQLEPLYRFYLDPLVETFGIEAVVEAYDHSADFTVLRNARTKKIRFAQLRMDQSNPWMRLTGLNFAQMYRPGEAGSYDLETDLPAIYYYTGYLGVWMTGLVLLLLVLGILRKIFKEGLISVLKQPGFCLASYLVLIFIVAAATGGSVFRRPSVSIYFAWFLAVLWAGSWPIKRRAKVYKR